MELTPNQRIVLLELTTKWETSIQFAEGLPDEWRSVHSLFQSHKGLLRESDARKSTCTWLVLTNFGWNCHQGGSASGVIAPHMMR